MCNFRLTFHSHSTAFIIDMHSVSQLLDDSFFFPDEDAIICSDGSADIGI